MVDQRETEAPKLSGHMVRPCVVALRSLETDLMPTGRFGTSRKHHGHLFALSFAPLPCAELPPADLQALADVKSASFGGLLGAGASVKGVKAVVIDGRCRDLAELRKVNLPVRLRSLPA